MSRIQWQPGMRTTAERLNEPLFVGRQAVTAQTLVSTVWARIELDTIDADGESGWDPDTPTRYHAQVAGWYDVRVGCSWTANATGSRGVRIVKGGTPVPGACVIGPTVTFYPPAYQVQKAVYLAVGEWVAGEALQDSGGNLLTAVANFDVGPILEVRHIHG
jgi:hypothetical protein